MLLDIQLAVEAEDALAVGVKHIGLAAGQEQQVLRGAGEGGAERGARGKVGEVPSGRGRVDQGGGYEGGCQYAGEGMD